MQERQGTRVASSDEGQRRQRPALEDAVHLCHEPLPVQPKQATESLTPVQAGAESSAINARQIYRLKQADQERRVR